MKIVQFFMFVLLFGSLLSGCAAAAQPAATPLGEPIKGYELYSWQDGGQWRFSLLIGTNREKTLEEIKSADVLLAGVDELVSVLAQVPSGQYITWSAKETLSFPPENIIEQVKQTCDDQGLILNIAL
jgi:hypothetical protein